MTTHTFSNTIGHFRTESGANQALVVLMSDSPHERAKHSLIPETTVIDGNRNRAAAIAARPVLSEGDVISIDADQVYVAHRVERNRDSWRLVPVHLLRRSKRFYVTFEGQGSWTIRDAANQGASVSPARIAIVIDPSADERDRTAAANGRETSTTSTKWARINSLADAESAVEMLHLYADAPTWNDYLAAIDKLDAA